VAELLPKEKRGLGTSLVAGVGLTGAVAAFFFKENFHWRTCYFIGGGLGFMLLLLRVGVLESGMFQNIRHSNVIKGNFLMLFNNGKRLKKYLCSILIGLPTWYVIGILVSFSKEFGEKMGVAGEIDPGKAVMFAYAAISIGDIAVGLLSQALQSRKKALYIFYGITAIGIVWFFNLNGQSVNSLYAACALLGFGTGFWAIFVTMAAEQFGTNIRATATTTVPNMVRGALILISILFTSLQGSVGYVKSGLITGVTVMVIGIVATLLTEETFHKDLNYIEE
jgi:MFS transporter, putative metabolite:H+ symporter